MIPAAVYARYSSHNQTDASIEQQISAAQDYASTHDLAIVATYADRAISGTTDHRPQFQQMLQDSALGNWSVLICWKTDRFARNRYDSAIYKRQLRLNNVRVVYVKEDIPDGPSGILLEALLEALAEHFSANLSQNVRRGLAANAQDLKVNGRPPYGYLIGPDGRFMVDDTRAPVVREIFDRYAKGDGPSEIVRWLNDSGIRTTDGNEWGTTNLHHTISNVAYRGTYRYNGHVVENAFPAIVDDQTFAACQLRQSQATKSAPRARSGYRYILTGRIVCGICGRSMAGQTSTTRKKSGKTYTYHRYICRARAFGRPCGLKSVIAEGLENAVLSATRSHVLTPEAIARISALVADKLNDGHDNAILDDLRRTLEDRKTALTNLIRAVEQGIISSNLQARLSELESEISELERSIQDEITAHPLVDPDLISFWLSRFMDGTADSPASDDTLIREFIDRITVYPDRITVTYRLGVEGDDTVIPRENLPRQIISEYDGITVAVVGPVLVLEMVRAVPTRTARRSHPRE